MLYFPHRVVARGDVKLDTPGATMLTAQHLDRQWKAVELQRYAQEETAARARAAKKDDLKELVGFAIDDLLLTDLRDPLFKSIQAMHEKLRMAKEKRKFQVELETTVANPPKLTSNNNNTNNTNNTNNDRRDVCPVPAAPGV